MSSEKILIVEDDPDAQEILRRYLSGEGYQLSFASGGSEGLDLADSRKPDLMLLDLNLPDINGFDVLRRMQERPYLPVIVVTVNQDDTDKVLSLELGADDYITKPFNPRELLARIRVVLRRIALASQKEGEKEKIFAGELLLDISRRTLSAGGRIFFLTLTEFSLLKHFMKNQGVVLSRQQILDQVWGAGFEAEPRLVDVHVRSLRKKLSAASAKECIRSIRGVGYKFEP